MNKRLRTTPALMLLVLAGIARASDAITPAAPQFVALSVPDAAASARWYQEAFGLRVLDEIKPGDGTAHVIILTSDTLLLEILQLRAARAAGQQAVQNPQLTHGVFKVGFRVPDLDAAVGKMRAMKTRFETDIVDDARHGLRFVLLRDPDGNYVQLFGAPRAVGNP
jgi:catechol 2,3-dioxygenase-like lactoylglutathione lyase family enzyme